jgi:hypothetical protein
VFVQQAGAFFLASGSAAAPAGLARRRWRGAGNAHEIALGEMREIAIRRTKRQRFSAGPKRHSIAAFAPMARASTVSGVFVTRYRWFRNRSYGKRHGL